MKKTIILSLILGISLAFKYLFTREILMDMFIANIFDNPNHIIYKLPTTMDKTAAIITLCMVILGIFMASLIIYIRKYSEKQHLYLFIKVLEIGIVFFYIFYPFESQVIKTILGTVILVRMIDLTVKGISRMETKT